jgi:hypothetical protein
MAHPLLCQMSMRILVFVIACLSGTAGLATAQTVRIDQHDSSIQYSGNWWSNTSSAHHGGVAALSNTRGARATITFTGRGITWIGMADAWAGLATVYLDGTMQAIDTYSAVGRYQAPLFDVHGLAAGTHTLSIEVTHERGPHTSGSWVWIDAFVIDEGAAVPGGVSAGTGRIEERHAALGYTGRWYHNAGSALSGGTAVLAMDAGSRVTIAFNGTGVAWIGYRDEWSGVANVYLDGEPKTTFDAYLSPARSGQTLYGISGLSSGAHTLTIEATGTRSASARGAWIWVDAFDILP